MMTGGKGPEALKHRVFISYCNEGSAAKTSDRNVAVVCRHLGIEPVMPPEPRPPAPGEKPIPGYVKANELVRYSRAGDAFHYRWAARRCLRMIYPKSRLRAIVIEGSKESELDGEYVIDVAEYSESADGGAQEIAYYQLKHTTVRNDQPLNPGDLKDTISGFKIA